MTTLKVTTELRESIKKFSPTTKINYLFSDSRLRKTAVGVKIVNVYFPIEVVIKICKDMNKKGFSTVSIKIASDKRSNFNGTRFTFMKQSN